MSPTTWIGTDTLNNTFYRSASPNVLIVTDMIPKPATLSKLNFNNTNGTFSQEVCFYQRTSVPSLPYIVSITNSYISKDGAYFYAAKQAIGFGISPEIVVMDLRSNDSLQIRQSERSLGVLLPQHEAVLTWFIGQQNRVYFPSVLRLPNGSFKQHIHELKNPDDFMNSHIDTSIYKDLGVAPHLQPFPDFYNNPNRYGLSAYEGLCLGDSTRFKLYDYHNLTAVLWHFGDSTAAGTDTSSNPRPTYLYPALGRYTVTVYATYCNHTDTLVQEIEILAPPVSPALPDTALCVGSDLPLALPAQTGNSVLWSSGDSSWSTSFSSAGWQWVEISNACFSTRDSFYVSLHEAPQSGLPTDTNGCPGDVLLLTPDAGDYSWAWQDGSTVPLSVTESGTYALLMTNACGTFVHEVQVQFRAAPVLVLNDTSRCEGQFYRIELPDTWQGAYQWNDGSSERIRILTDSGWYSAQITNPCGTASDAFYLSLVDCACHMYLPTAFTPNGDGLNDELVVITRCPLSHFQLEVYNRWGQQIFASNDIRRGWDGTYQGELLPPGSYPFLIRYVPEGRNARVEKGVVHLLR